MTENMRFTTNMTENMRFTTIMTGNMSFTTIMTENMRFTTIMTENMRFTTIMTENTRFTTIMTENTNLTKTIKKKSLWFQSIPFSKYPYTLGILDNICFHFKLNAKKGRLVLPPSTFQSGEGNCPQLLAHEVVLVKFELQIHTEHLSS
jgi:hypothetical protein